MLLVMRRHGAVAPVPAKFNLLNCGQLLLRKNLVSEHINLNKERVELSMVTRAQCHFLSTSDDEPMPVLVYSDVSEGHDSVEDGDSVEDDSVEDHSDDGGESDDC